MVHPSHQLSNLEVQHLGDLQSILGTGLVVVCHPTGAAVQAGGLLDLLFPGQVPHSIHLPLRPELLRLDTTVHQVHKGPLRARHASALLALRLLRPQHSRQQVQLIPRRVRNMAALLRRSTPLQARRIHHQAHSSRREPLPQVPHTRQPHPPIPLLPPHSLRHLQDPVQVASVLHLLYTHQHHLAIHQQVLLTNHLDRQ